MIKLYDIIREIKTYTLYLDLDGVLCDFDKAFKDITGYYPDEFENTYGSQQFWEKVDAAGIEFWSTLSWMPSGEDFWKRLNELFDDITILTKSSKNKNSVFGKQIWIQHNLGDVKRIITRQDKGIYCMSPYSILIDDTEKNIVSWNDAGGIGILHKDIDTTLKLLEKIL